MIWQGVILAMFQTEQTAPTLPISMVFPYSAIPFGAALLWIEAFQQFLKAIFSKDQEGETC